MRRGGGGRGWEAKKQELGKLEMDGSECKRGKQRRGIGSDYLGAWRTTGGGTMRVRDRKRPRLGEDEGLSLGSLIGQAAVTQRPTQKFGAVSSGDPGHRADWPCERISDQPPSSSPSPSLLFSPSSHPHPTSHLLKQPLTANHG